MKLYYDSQTDSLYIELSDRASVDSQEAAPGIVLDVDEKGRLVGIDVDRASRIADLSRLEAIALPVGSVSLSNR